MRKARTNQSGFGALEVLLVLIFVAVGVFVGFYVHNSNSHANAKLKEINASIGPETRFEQDAVASVQKTYDGFVAAVNNAGPTNSLPLGIVGLNAVKNYLTDDFYNKAGASINGSDFSCAAQYIPKKYVTGVGNSTLSSAKITISTVNRDNGFIETNGMFAIVDLNTLKITSVICPGK